MPVTTLLRFDSTAGRFYVAKDTDHRYHILFNGKSIATYADMAVAVESFVHESNFYILHPELGYPLDAHDLSIPDDISGWEPDVHAVDITPL